MKYSFTCPSCQMIVPVDASLSGSEMVCECGSKAQVPRLSQLRTMSGEGAYEAGTVDTILRMLDEGSLPWGDTCALSGSPTADRMELHVECEKVHFRSNHDGLFFLSVLLLGWVGVALNFSKSIRESDPQGRDTKVRTPLRVARSMQGALSKMKSQRKLRRLLCQVPVYDKLLREFPKAQIVVGDLPEESGMKFDPAFAG